ncbi:MAG: dephospho-CoA kinase [Clostridia bacterium]|nr:dephospho-CoA kinase [Clostridia bacterium]
MDKNKKLIAVTGGIGSGKSSALKIIKDAGYYTLSSDLIVSELYEKRRVKKLLKTLFPDAVTGLIKLKIDRKKISQKVFFDKVLHKKLTALITPLVLEEILRKTAKKTGLLFVEVPLLFECGYEKNFDKVLIISRALSARIESVQKRSNLTEQEILARIKNQFDYDNADLSPYTVIQNDGSINDLQDKILSFIKEL